MRGDAGFGAGVVRVQGATGVAGAGFVVAPDAVVTCAHVVTAAVGGDAEADRPPTGTVEVAFPLAGGETRRGSVDRWLPIRADGGGDVALLRLDTPAPGPARVPPMLRPDDPWDREFRALGFPGDLTDGEWATGHLLDAQGSGWLQLRGTPGGARIGPGYSGTPVWDTAARAVVGMAVAARPDGPATAFLIPIQDVLGIDPALLPNPYRGLRPFGEEHAAYFYGRDADAGRVLRTLETSPIAAVTGRSGTGKSSLVRAGVLPRLRAEGARILTYRVTSGEPAVPALTALLGPYGTDLPEDGVVLVADQFEELAAARPADARAVLEHLVALAGPRLRVLLTLRWEAMNELLTEPLAGPLAAATVPLGPMARTQLREAIAGPAARAPGLFFEPGLVERILDDAGDEPGVLPLLESALSQLWEARDGGVLRAATYEELGGVREAVAAQAGRVWAGLGERRPAARRLLTALARPASGGGFTGAAVPLGTLDAEARDVAGVLAAHRLVVLGADDDGPQTVRLAHQALIDHWPKLRGWLAADRAFLLWRDELDGRYEKWRASGEDDGALLRGGALHTAQEYLAGRGAELPDGHRAFITASAARQRREVRRWRAVAAVLVVLVLVAGTLAAVVTRANSRLNAALGAANAKTLAEAANARMRQYPDTGTQLALAAYQADPDSPEARTALGRAYLAGMSADRVFSGISDTLVTAFDAAPRGDAVLVKRGGGYAVATGVATGRPRTWRLPGLAPGAEPALSPDGTRVAAVTGGHLLTWDVRRRTGPRALMTAAGGGARPNFSADGHRLAWWSPKEGLRLWDFAAGRAASSRIGSGDPVTEAWPAGDPSMVALRYRGRVEVRNVATGKTVRKLPAKDAIAAGGTLSVHCAPPPAASTDTPAVITATRITDGTRTARIATRAYGACGSYLSQDREHLVRIQTGEDGDNAFLSVTSLRDGREYELAAPSQWDTNPGPSKPGSGAWRVYPRFAVVGGKPLLGAGTGLVRYAGLGPPTPRGRDQAVVGPTDDGRSYVVQSTDGAPYYASVDRRTGREVARLPGRAPPAGRQIWTTVDGNTFVAAVADHGRMVASAYAMPSLRRIGTFRLPAPAGTGTNGTAEVTPHFAAVGDRLIALSGGVLSAWDLTTGRQAGGPTTPATAPRDLEWIQSEAGGDPDFVPRPGHPEQVAVVTRTGGLDLWDVHARRRVDRLPTHVYTGSEVAYADQLAIDPSGRYAAFRNPDDDIEVWDLDARRPVRSAIPMTNLREVLGFTRNGGLVISTAAVITEQYSVLDIHSGRQSGPFTPGGPTSIPDGVMRDGDWLVTGTDGVQFFPLDPHRQAAHLCAVQDRPYTATERALLPPGAGTDPPCP